MKDVFAKLAIDFFSTIVFIAVYLITDNVLLATGVAIAGAVAQVIYAHIKGQQLGFMTYASLALVIVLGSATLLTSDPRFVLAKPAIAHFAIGAIMLKRGWMLRYVPPIVVGDHSGIRHPGGLRLGRADVRARRRHHRDRADRRHEIVGDLCVRGGGRCENRGLCRAICRVSHPGQKPASRRQRVRRRLGFGDKMRYTAARLADFQNHSGFANRIVRRPRWPWTETGTSS